MSPLKFFKCAVKYIKMLNMHESLLCQSWTILCSCKTSIFYLKKDVSYLKAFFRKQNILSGLSHYSKKFLISGKLIVWEKEKTPNITYAKNPIMKVFKKIN